MAALRRGKHNLGAGFLERVIGGGELFQPEARLTAGVAELVVRGQNHQDLHNLVLFCGALPLVGYAGVQLKLRCYGSSADAVVASLATAARGISHSVKGPIQPGIDAVTLGEPLRIVVGKPGRPILVLPNRRLEREINSRWSARPASTACRPADCRRFGRSQLHTDRGRRRSMVDTRRDRKPAGCYCIPFRALRRIWPSILPWRCARPS